MIRKPQGSKFRVFHRCWWRQNSSWPDGREPNPGARKALVGYAKTADEARSMCRVWNANHPPGKFSDKAEFEAL